MAAATSTIQKWLGWCSHSTSSSGLASSSANPTSGRSSTSPTGQSRTGRVGAVAVTIATG